MVKHTIVWRDRQNKCVLCVVEYLQYVVKQMTQRCALYGETDKARTCHIR